ncbi:MAG: TldD/PmbA family protein, partial [Bdellovibrionales bacterium]|nr:TldD/PmbA family protein [Bdellovibrionales bacterium]
VSVVLNRDDFLFIDEKVRMSQTILRNLTNAMVLKNGERGYTLMGGLGGQETVEIPDHQFLETYEYLEKTLNAEKLKPGRYKLLMGPSVTGVFAHEAFGHSQEGDTWARGRSQAKILYEQQTEIGNKHATIYNNPAIYKNGSDEFAAWGSYYFDEEGWLAQEHCLVKEGKLQQPMTNLTSSLRLNMPRTANGKRESWMRGMYVRQTNTYFSAGEKTYDDLIAQVDYGFQAVHAAGGMEDPKGMGIQVGIAYLEEIKNGQLTGKTFVGPNGGSVQMTGYVPDYLGSIVDKAKIDHFDDSFDESQHPWNEVGGCGKYHKESVMAGCGGPYMLLENVLLG